MTKDNQRQGMRELLAQQRAGDPLTPAEAARQRRSGSRGHAPDSAGSYPVGAGLLEGPPSVGQGRPGETAAAVGDAAVETETRAGGRRVTARGRGRAGGKRGALAAAACALAIPVLCWLVAARRRQATAQAANAKGRRGVLFQWITARLPSGRLS
jgi:hypothetical protein